MAQVRKIIGIVLLSAVGAVLALWFAVGLWAIWLGPSWFAGQLHERFGIDVAIGALRTDFFHSVSFRDIVVSEPARGRIDEIRLAIRPWDLFSLRPRNRHLFVLTLKNPDLSFNGPFSTVSPGKRSGLVALPLAAFRGSIENGHLAYVDGDRRWDLSQINGFVRATPFRIETEADATVGGVGRVSMSGRSGFAPPQNWELRLSSERLDAAGVAALVGERAARLGQFAGPVAAEATFKGTAGRGARVNDWKVAAHTDGLRWTPPGKHIALPVRGRIEAGPSAVDLKNVALAKAVIDGSVEAPWNDPRLNLRVKATAQPLDEIVAAASGGRPPPLHGTVDVDGTVAGTASSPTATARFSMSPIIGAVKLPTIDGNAEFSGDAAAAQFSFAGGQVAAKGGAIRSKEAVWTVEASGLSIADVGALNGWRNVAGVISARFTATPGEGQLSGRVDMNAVRWGRVHLAETKGAAVRLTRAGLSVESDDQSVSLSATKTSDGVRLDHLKLGLGGDGTLAVAGTISGEERRLDLSLDAENVSADVWPPLVERYPNIDGTIDAKGTLRGTAADPKLEASLTVPALRFQPDGGAWSGTAALAADRSSVSIDRLEVDGGYRASGRWSFATGRWSAEADLRAASPQLIWDLAGATGTVTGAVSAHLRAEKKETTVATSSASWTSGQINGFFFDELSASASMEGDRLRFDQLALVKGAQAIRGGADLHRRGDGWRYDAYAQLQRWGRPPLVLDGEIQSDGTIAPAARRIEGNVTAPVLWIADRSLEEVSAAFRASPDGSTLRFTAGDQVSINAALAPGGAISGRAQLKNLRLEDLFTARASTSGPHMNPTGNYDLTARLDGSLADPRAGIDATIRDGEWRGEKFDARLALDVNRSTVGVSAARLTLAAGGSALVHGAIGLGKGAAVRLNGTGDDVDLQAIFHLLAWPIHWQGKTDATFSVTSGSGTVVTDISFDGEHEGFGPFREGGRAHGRIVGRGREWTLDGIYVESGDGHAEVKPGSKVYLDRDGAGRIRVVADVRNLQMGPLTLFGGAECVGQWPAEMAGRPRRIDLDLFARSLWMNQFILDGAVTRLAMESQKLTFSPVPGSSQQISGTLAYDQYPDLNVENLKFVDAGIEKLNLSGNVGTARWNFRLRAKSLDAAIVRGLFDTRFPLTGLVNADIRGHGSPSQPLIEADVHWTNGRLGVLPLDTADGKIAYHAGRLRLSDVSVQKRRGYLLRGDARLDLREEGPSTPVEINIRIDKGDLAFLPDMFPEFSRGRGNFDGRLRIGGSPGRVAISGYLNAHKVSLRSVYTPDLDRGEVRLLIEKNRLTVDRVVARVGRGEVKAGGTVDFVNGWPATYDVTLRTTTSQGISIRVPQLTIAPGPVLGRFSLLKKQLAGISRADALVDLAFKGPAAGPTLEGSVTLENSVFTYPSSQPGGEAAPAWWRALIARMNWDVDLKAGKRTWFQNELVDANISGDVAFQGPTDDLRINGRIHSEQGSIVYSGNEFQIKDADLEIETRRLLVERSDSKQTIVYLKATAEKEVFYTDALANSNQETIVMTVDRAPIGEIQPRFYAKNNPGLSSQRALQLALGLPFSDSIESNSLLPDQRSRTNVAADNDKMLRLGLVQLLDSSLASPLARALARRTGLVDFIRVTYQEQDPHAQEGIAPDQESKTAGSDVTQNQFLRYAKGTKVRFGRGLGQRLFADYSFRVDEYQNQLNLRHEVELAYRVHRNLFLRGVSELDRERELGRPPDRRAILENQWRFGLPRKKPAPSPSPSSGIVPRKDARAGRAG